jgi:hypothetical protein
MSSAFQVARLPEIEHERKNLQASSRGTLGGLQDYIRTAMGYESHEVRCRDAGFGEEGLGLGECQNGWRHAEARVAAPRLETGYHEPR